MELGGCDNSLLDLRRILPLNWIKQLEISAEDAVSGHELPQSTDDSAADKGKEIQEASARTQSCDKYDNSVHYLSSSDKYYNTLAHFQKHWRKGQPVIFRNVLQCASALNLDPLSLFCSCLENNPSSFSHGKSDSEVVNSEDWYEVEIRTRESLTRSLEGFTHRRRKTLRVIAKLPSTFSQRILGDCYSEITHALPLQLYTNPSSGLLNIAGKLPEDFSESKLGPHLCISFGSREVVARGELVTRLNHNPYDVVNILSHVADVTCSAEQLNQISMLIKQNNKADQTSHNGEKNVSGMNGALVNGFVGGFCCSPATNDIPVINSRDNKSLVSESEQLNQISMLIKHNNKADQIFHNRENNVSGMNDEISGELGGQYRVTKGVALVNGFVGGSCCSPVTNDIPVINSRDNKSPASSTSNSMCKFADEMSQLEQSESSTLSDKRPADVCGAQWDVFRRQDVPKLLEYITKHAEELSCSCGSLKNVVHPVYDGSFYLDSIHKMRLKEEFDVEPWMFNQCLGEAVFIPAGCPYQIKNVKSCINIALGFISPENASECIKLINETRILPNNHKAKQVKLEVEKMTLRSIDEAIKEIYRLRSEESSVSQQVDSNSEIK